MTGRITKIFTSVIISAILLLNTVPYCCAASNNVYYVDSVSGNDDNSGTDENSPWKSLAKVNATTFQPGDIIRLKAGCEWIGQLNPKGSGTEGSPITVTAYGVGEKPHIKGDGTTDTAFLLYNQQYWVIDGIQVSNNASAVGDFRGIGIKGIDAGALRHFTIKNCYIHDVMGQVTYFGTNDSYYEDGKKTGGIIFWTDTVSGTPTWFEDVLIENNEICYNGFNGIGFKQTNKQGWALREGGAGDSNWKPHRYITIRNNYFEQNNPEHQRVPILLTAVKGAVIEKNMLNTPIQCGIELNYADSVLVQFNEVYNSIIGNNGADSCSMDFDRACTNTVWQFNYINDCNVGFLSCHGIDDWDFGYGNLVRYNIFQNCKETVLLDVSLGGPDWFYDNIFYNDKYENVEIFKTDSKECDTRIVNNIFYNTPGGATYNEVKNGRTIDNNVYWGDGIANNPYDANARRIDPKFADPGKGGTGTKAGPAFATLGGYCITEPSVSATSAADALAQISYTDDTYYEKVAEYAASKGEKPAEAYIYGWDIYVYEPVSPNADIVASADTYVDNEMWSRTSNNGNLTAGLIGDYSYLSYIRFDVKDVKYAYGRAKLSLWCKDSSPRKVGIYGISDNSWDEAALNWKTAPGIITTETGFDSNTTIKLGEIITSGAGRYELDISEYFAANKFNDAITVGITGEDGNCTFFASKEDTDSRNRKPYLNVALDVSSLAAKVDEANALADSIKVGAGEGECTQQAKDEFSSAIATAQSVTNKWDAAESEISDAVAALDAAMTTFGSSVNNNAVNSYNETLAKAKQLQSKVTTDKYTQAAIDAYAAAITAAETLAANGEYNQATADLEAAMETLLAGHVASPGVELSGTDDAYIQKGNPDANYAGSESSTNLIVGNSGDIYLAYLKFDISAYPGEYGRAKLRFFSKDTSGYTLGIYGLSDTSWSESTLTWNNAPNRGDSGFGTGAVKIGEITTSGRQNYEFDLGTYFKAHNADDYISIGIAMESNTNAFLSQGENADPSCRPVLTLGLDASALEAAIDEARILYDSTPVGLEIGNCTQQLKDNLAAAISAAEKVYGDYSKTKAEYTSAAESLNSAIESFRAGIVSIGIEITEMTVNGIPADTLSAGEVKVRVKVTNIGAEPENADIYFALMKETDESSSLEDVDFKSVEVSADGNVICEGALTVDDAEGACIRIFCWDKNLCPETVNLTK